MRRLFVAADIGDGAREACAHVAEWLRETYRRGRWVAPENYHLTVAFLGGVGDDRLAEVLDGVRAAAARVPPFEIVLDTVGAFPNERRPRVVWVGPSAPTPAFTTLCGVVRSALVTLGFAFDAHADAHVTLARADGAVSPLPLVDVPWTPPLRIDAVTLYESFTERAGARYVPLERFALRT